MGSIHKVAEIAGVSASTVSRVINGTKYVSPEIRERVLKAIAELQFQPSLAARNLRLQQTQIIGVLLPSFEDYFFGRLAFVIEKALVAQGYRPLFCSTENAEHKEMDYLRMMTAQRVDGVLMVPTSAREEIVEQIDALRARGTPLVLVDNGIPDLSVSQILPDNWQGGYKAGHHLLELGHRRIAIIVPGAEGRPPESGGGYERIAGMRQAFEDMGAAWNPVYLVEDLNYIDMGYAGTRLLVERHSDVTAAFALTDQIAIGVLRQMYDLGLRVPDQLSVLGYGNIPLSAHLVPRLTTVAQPIEQMGNLAVGVLLRQLSDPDAAPEVMTLDTDLIVRESTAPPRPTPNVTLPG